MKKKLVAIACAAALMLALPALAWAAPSPAVEGNATGDNGVALNVKAGNGTIVVTKSDTHAVASVAANETLLSSFSVTGTDAGNITLTFNVGSQYAGANYTVYVKHDDGTSETFTGKVAADGTVTVTVAKLSIFTIAVDKSTIGGGSNVDTGSKSPQTGVDLGVVAGGTLAAAVAAGAVALVLRKKVTE